MKSRLKLFSFIPWGQHTIEFVSVDDEKYIYRSKEFGTNIKSWIHELRIVPRDGNSCSCHDVIEFEAGLANVFVWVFSQLLYRFRYFRRRRLLARR